MNMIGLEVCHRKWGNGKIVGIDSNYDILVLFDGESGRFKFPEDFQDFELDIIDHELIDKLWRKMRECEDDPISFWEKEIRADHENRQKQLQDFFTRADAFNEDLLVRLGLEHEVRAIYNKYRMDVKARIKNLLAKIDARDKDLDNFIADEINLAFYFLCGDVGDFALDRWSVFSPEPKPEETEWECHFFTVWERVYRTFETSHSINVNPIDFDEFLKYLGKMFNDIETALKLDDYQICKDNQKQIQKSLAKRFSFDEQTAAKPIVCDFKELTVYGDLHPTSCNRRSHIIVPDVINCRLENGSILPIPVHYCRVCKKYFIEKESFLVFNRLIKEYLVAYPAVNLKDFFRGTQSKLYSLGYNVRENGGLSSKERKKLLIKLYESGKIDEFEIRRDISSDIHRFKNHPNCKKAVAKWKDDLKYFNIYLLK